MEELVKKMNSNRIREYNERVEEAADSNNAKDRQNNS